MAANNGIFSGLPGVPLTSAQLARDKRLAFSLLLVTAVFGLAAAFIFVRQPGLDFTLTDMLRANDRFVLQGDDKWSLIRRFTMWGYGLVYGVMVIGLVYSTIRKAPVWSFYPAQWLYLVACSLAGPLLVTNLVLKTYIGRPRPRSVTEYGGRYEFKELFEAGGKCVDNCSFVSGEVSSMVMIFAGMMFVTGKWRWLFALLLLPAWAFSAYLRVGAGAHFPSDTLFAGVFMIIIAAILYRLIVLAPGNVTVRDQ
jgi:lipid A 4'-phosphatase